MREKLDMGFLIISVLVGILIAGVAEVIYYAPFESRILTILLYFICFILIMSVMLIGRSLQSGTYVNTGRVMWTSICAVLGFVCLATIFEFVYEIDMGNEFILQKPVQFVFLIDDSGSMEKNDPDNERYRAIEDIINELEQTDSFSVYQFSDDVKKLTDFGESIAGNYEFNENDNIMLGGNTNLFAAITSIIKELDTDNCVTKIVLLTDGLPSDYRVFTYGNFIKTLVNSCISISSVSFGIEKAELLENLAIDTGGVYVSSDNVERIYDGLHEVVTTDIQDVTINRDLLGYRNDEKAKSILYGLMRVIFLSVLGSVWTFIKVALLGEIKFEQMKVLISSVILCVISAILCEVLLLGFGLPDTVPRTLLCILWATTLIPKYCIEKQKAHEVKQYSSQNKTREVGGYKEYR